MKRTKRYLAVPMLFIFSERVRYFCFSAETVKSISKQYLIMGKSKVIKFLKIYAVFFLFALLINLTLEIVFRLVVRIPEPLDIRGIIIFFSIFNFFGSTILFYKTYRPVKMGLLSLVFGQICEFTFMRPEWVQNLYALKIGGETIAPFVISSILYWFPAWFIPSYIAHKHIIKLRVRDHLTNTYPDRIW